MSTSTTAAMKRRAPDEDGAASEHPEDSLERPAKLPRPHQELDTVDADADAAATATFSRLDSRQQLAPSTSVSSTPSSSSFPPSSAFPSTTGASFPSSSSLRPPSAPAFNIAAPPQAPFVFPAAPRDGSSTAPVSPHLAYPTPQSIPLYNGVFPSPGSRSNNDLQHGPSSAHANPATAAAQDEQEQAREHARYHAHLHAQEQQRQLQQLNEREQQRTENVNERRHGPGTLSANGSEIRQFSEMLDNLSHNMRDARDGSTGSDTPGVTAPQPYYPFPQETASKHTAESDAHMYGNGTHSHPGSQGFYSMPDNGQPTPSLTPLGSGAPSSAPFLLSQHSAGEMAFRESIGVALADISPPPSGGVASAGDDAVGSEKFAAGVDHTRTHSQERNKENEGRVGLGIDGVPGLSGLNAEAGAAAHWAHQSGHADSSRATAQADSVPHDRPTPTMELSTSTEAYRSDGTAPAISTGYTMQAQSNGGYDAFRHERIRQALLAHQQQQRMLAQSQQQRYPIHNQLQNQLQNHLAQFNAGHGQRTEHTRLPAMVMPSDKSLAPAQVYGDSYSSGLATPSSNGYMRGQSAPTNLQSTGRPQSQGIVFPAGNGAHHQTPHMSGYAPTFSPVPHRPAPGGHANSYNGTASTVQLPRFSLQHLEQSGMQTLYPASPQVASAYDAAINAQRHHAIGRQGSLSHTLAPPPLSSQALAGRLAPMVNPNHVPPSPARAGPSTPSIGTTYRITQEEYGHLTILAKRREDAKRMLFEGPGSEMAPKLSDGERRRWSDEYLQANEELENARNKLAHAQYIGDRSRQASPADMEQTLASPGQLQQAALMSPAQTDYTSQQAGEDMSGSSRPAMLPQLSYTKEQSAIARQQVHVAPGSVPLYPPSYAHSYAYPVTAQQQQQQQQQRPASTGSSVQAAASRMSPVKVTQFPPTSVIFPSAAAQAAVFKGRRESMRAETAAVERSTVSTLPAMPSPSPPKQHPQRVTSGRGAGTGKIEAGSPRLTSQLSRVIAASQQQYALEASPARQGPTSGSQEDTGKTSTLRPEDSQSEQDIAAMGAKQVTGQSADDSGVALAEDEAKEKASGSAQANDDSFVTDAAGDTSTDVEGAQEGVGSPRADESSSGRGSRGRSKTKAKGKALAQVKVSVATRRSTRGQQDAAATAAAVSAEDAQKVSSVSPVKTRSAPASVKRKARESTVPAIAQNSPTSQDQQAQAPGAVTATAAPLESQSAQASLAPSLPPGTETAPVSAPSGSSSPLKKQITKRKNETVELAIGDLVAESEWNMSPHFKQLQLVYTNPDVKYLHYNWTVSEAQANRRLLRFSSSLDTAAGLVYVAVNVVSQEQYLLDLHANGEQDIEGSVVISVHFATGLFSNKRELETQKRLSEAQQAAERGQPYVMQPQAPPDSYFVTHYDIIRLVEKLFSSRTLHFLGQKDLPTRLSQRLNNQGTFEICDRSSLIPNEKTFHTHLGNCSHPPTVRSSSQKMRYLAWSDFESSLQDLLSRFMVVAQL